MADASHVIDYTIPAYPDKSVQAVLVAQLRAAHLRPRMGAGQRYEHYSRARLIVTQLVASDVCPPGLTYERGIRFACDWLGC